MEYMLMPFMRYFDFAGRSRRKEYWMFALFNIIVISVLITLMFAFGFSMDPYGSVTSVPAMLVAGLLGIYSLLVFIPGLAVQVRRFHDQDKSGWFVLINFVPYIGGIIVLVFMLMEGTRGPNRYGPDPKEGLPRGV